MPGQRPSTERHVDDRDHHDGELPPPPPIDGTPTPDHDRDLVVDENDRLVDRDRLVDHDRTADADTTRFDDDRMVDRDRLVDDDRTLDGDTARFDDDRMVDRDRDLTADPDAPVVARDRDVVEDRRVDRDLDDDDRVVVADHRDDHRDDHLDTDREIAVVRTRSFSLGQLITLALGGVLLALGIVALVRTGIETPFEEHVEDVLGWNHTPLLALIEIGAGALLVLCSLRPGGRFLAGIIGLALVAGGILMASEPDWSVENLAAEQGFGWLVAIGGVAVVIGAILTPRRHQVVTGVPVADDRR